MPRVNLLLFAAHCDDGELWAGGTIARLVDDGKAVVIAVVNHNATRRSEAKAGARVLGCEVWFRKEGVGTYDWVTDCLRRAKPEVVISHPVGDPHFEHDKIGRTVLKALTKSDKRKEYPTRWYWYDTYNSITQYGFPVLLDISNSFERKCSALKRHKSQSPEELIHMSEAINALHGNRIRTRYAEAFYVFPLLGRWPRLRDSP